MLWRSKYWDKPQIYSRNHSGSIVDPGGQFCHWGQWQEAHLDVPCYRYTQLSMKAIVDQFCTFLSICTLSLQGNMSMIKTRFKNLANLNSVPMLHIAIPYANWGRLPPPRQTCWVNAPATFTKHVCNGLHSRCFHCMHCSVHASLSAYANHSANHLQCGFFAGTNSSSVPRVPARREAISPLCSHDPLFCVVSFLVVKIC